MSETSMNELSRMRKAFEAELEKSGLAVPADEIETLFQGYCGLQGLVALLPRDIPMSAEPAMIAVAAGARVIR